MQMKQHKWVSVWRKWVKFHQWQRITTNPPVNTSSTLSLPEHSRALLYPLNRFICLFVFIWACRAEKRTQASECSHLCGQVRHKAGLAGQEPAHSCVHANSSSGSQGAPHLPLWKHCILVHLFARTHFLQCFPIREEPPQVSPICSEFSQPGLGRILDTWDSELCSLFSESWASVLNWDSLDGIKTAANYFCENTHTYLHPSIKKA